MFARVEGMSDQRFWVGGLSTVPTTSSDLQIWCTTISRPHECAAQHTSGSTVAYSASILQRMTVLTLWKYGTSSSWLPLADVRPSYGDLVSQAQHACSTCAFPSNDPHYELSLESALYAKPVIRLGGLCGSGAAEADVHVGASKNNVLQHP